MVSTHQSRECCTHIAPGAMWRLGSGNILPRGCFVHRFTSFGSHLEAGMFVQRVDWAEDPCLDDDDIDRGIRSA